VRNLCTSLECFDLFLKTHSFKINEMDDLSTISPNIAFSYLLLWDCILNFCSLAPAELRSIYARWITAHQYEEVKNFD
jgi:E3 ubiquitin-protein ligase listerin